MMETNDVYRMALTLIPGIGAITAKKLIAYTGSPEGVFRERRTVIEKIPGIGEFLAGKLSAGNYLSRAERELSVMQKSGIRSCYYLDAHYPERLKNCEDGPLLLFHKGAVDFNADKIVSIVGTRSATAYGRDTCRSLVEGLAARYPRLVVVSGLAYGIDIIAHRAALDFGIPTLAVLAHGLKTIYPQPHRETAEKIMSQGGLATDFHSWVKPERNNFLRRNRIIAGIADATLVVESGIKGGALITAELAGSYHRDVLAVPGRASDTYSKGCNDLIRRNIGALADSVEAIEHALNWEPESPGKAELPPIPKLLGDDERKILQTILTEPSVGIEIISARTEIPVHRLMGMLLHMELNNLVRVEPGNRYRASVRM